MHILPTHCSVCKEPCSKHCSNCRKVSYCSIEHQKLHRKKHKPDCFPAVVQQDEIRGRYLAATRDIKPGEKILRDAALIIAPNGNTASRFEFKPMCLSCYRLVSPINKSGEFYNCSVCGWPLCDEKCEKMRWHADYECEVFAKSKVAPFTCARDYDSIKVLRALLTKEKAPEIWSKICELESHEGAREKNPLCRKKTYSSVMFIKTTCNLSQFDYKDINFVVGVFRVNAFGLYNWASQRKGFKEASLLFYNGSMFAHDCIPNTRSYLEEELHSKSIGYYKNVVATVLIREGESINKSYIDTRRGTPERRTLLNRSFHFGCSCRRCSDPTECGLFYSAIKCQHCDTGYVLLQNPLDFESDWECDSCKQFQPNSYVYFVNTEAEEQFNNVLDDESQKDTLTIIQRLETILKEHQGKTFHKNHWLMMEIEYEIVKKWRDYIMENEKPICKQVKFLAPRIMQLCTHCLDVGNVLRPGLSIYRGCMLLSLALAMAVAQTNMVTISSKAADAQHQLKRLQEIKATAEEGKNIILFAEPEGSDERKLAEDIWEHVNSMNF